MKSTSRAELAQDVSRRVRQALFDAVMRLGGGDTRADEAALTVERACPPLAPALLAAAHPGGETVRAEMRALYGRCLAHYRQVLRTEQADAGVDDVGAAVAHFVAANMQALHGGTVTPPMLLRLERQLAGVVKRSAKWASASARERQLYFEKMAILAVLIGETSAQAARQGPAAVANVQRAARGYLRDLIGLDPDHLALGVDGLAMRPIDSDAVSA
jgi:hypothetical protein